MTELLRIKPDSPRPATNFARSLLFVMSDWSEARDPSLMFPLIDAELQKPAQKESLPTVIVIDDLEYQAMEYQQLLADLTHAGAYVIQAEDEYEQELIRQEPVPFANKMLAASQQTQPVVPMSEYQEWLSRQTSATPSKQASSTPQTVNLDGYKEFAKAITRLSAKDLEEMMDPSN